MLGFSLQSTVSATHEDLWLIVALSTKVTHWPAGGPFADTLEQVPLQAEINHCQTEAFGLKCDF